MVKTDTGIKAARAYLEQIGKVDRLIGQLTQAADDLRRSLTGRNSYALNPDKVQTSQPGSRTEETMVKIIDLEQQIDSYIDEVVDRKRDALNRIRKMPDFDQQALLVARYVQMMRLDEIAEEWDRSTTWVYDAHRAAIRSFTKYNIDLSDTEKSCL